ncbi:MAG TPA: MMPL family transporter [Acidimicrobiia bacterium]
MLKTLGSLVARRPWWAVATVVVVTAILGVFAAQQETDADITAFAPETEQALAFDRVQDQFAGSGGSAQVIVDAGEDGNIITAQGVQAAIAVQEAALADPEVAGDLAGGGPTAPPVFSFATPIVAAAQQQGADPATLTDQQVAGIAQQVYTSEQGASAASLTSQDRDLAAGSARAGLVVVQFDPDLTELEQQDVSLALRDAVSEVDVPGVEIDVFSVGILFSELEGGIEEELPFLLGLSFLLIIVILGFIYRSVSDVVIGLLGLVVSITWMYGIAVLLGPDYLGLVGAFTQISIVVPVLLVGLGIDYAVHLTSRYREERALDETPPEAARMAVLTVGGALVLATVTTIIGFLTNVVSPLPPIADFGVFAAAGVLSSFVVMGFLVPATRNLLDRRRHARGKKSQADDTSALAKFMGRAALLTEHIPVVTLLVAAIITAAAVLAATNISTQFSQEEFIPEDSEAATLLGKLDTLFGGDLTERSYVLIDGDFTDVEMANAVLASQQNMTDTEYVRTAGGRAAATSAPSIVLQTANTAGQQQPELGQQFAALGVTPEGFASDADLAALYELTRQVAPGQLGQVLDEDSAAGVISIPTTAGEDNVEALAEGLRSDIAPLEATGAETIITSQGLVIAEVLDSLTESQTRSIIITLAAALVLLIGYYWVADRRPFLGLVTMIPSLVVVAWTLGTMWLLGMSFNVLTATVASLAIGIGVPYGIHVTHRYMEERQRAEDVDDAVRLTVTHTGAALAGAALTTAAGFGVLVFASLIPIQQFGTVVAITIIYSLIAAVLVQPSCLVLWDRYDRRHNGTPHHEPTAMAGHES